MSALPNTNSDKYSARAAITAAKGAAFELQTIQLDPPRSDEVLVRLVGVGICHTDVIIREQYYPTGLPIILGHEGSGVVEAVGSAVQSLAPGDHVVLTFMSCGKCRQCLSGLPSYCDDSYKLNFSGARADGSVSAHTEDGSHVHNCFFGQSSFSTHVLTQERNTIKVPKTAPLALLGPLGCGIQTGAGAVLNALQPKMGDSIAIFGAGTVGLSAIMAARVTGASKIVAVDLVESRLALARELGATHVINAGSEDTSTALKAIAPTGVDFTLDTTGNKSVLRSAIDALGMRGVCGIVGATRVGTECAFDMTHVMTGGRSIRGIIEGDSIPATFIPRLIALHEGGQFPFDKLLKTYPFEAINEAVADSESGITIKPVLVF